MVTKMVLFCQVLWVGVLPLFGHPNSTQKNDKNLEQQVLRLIKSEKIAGVGIGIIRKGRLQWTGYFGEQALGKPITRQTMFNTGSLAKTVAAETVLRLVAKGKIDLDAPIIDHVKHRDLATDPRYQLLTPRLLLSHQAALLNWSYAYEDGKLAFIDQPGHVFSYSGAGYELLAEYIAAKTGQTYEELVSECIFKPLGLKGASVSRAAWMEHRVPMPMDKEGIYHQPFTYPESGWEKPRGDWSAADDLFITVEDYAKFLISVMNNQAMTESLAQERHKVIASVATTEHWACILETPGDCPNPFGYGLGWTIFNYPHQTLIQHGGNDFGEHAFVYFNPVSRDGTIVFINGGNGWRVSVALIDLIDPNQKLGTHFRALIAKYFNP